MGTECNSAKTVALKNTLSKSERSDIKIVIRWKVKGQIFKHMVTCPHCFYITEGVFFPNSK
ncbi:hypothetical protein BWK63_12725 [Flavobacterium covae]|nr:hypothetical protein BWK63_12725 [Flavobacterium covae]POR20574.1 hypothetical protein BWK57_13055 [Flavobacterium columnare]